MIYYSIYEYEQLIFKSNIIKNFKTLQEDYYFYNYDL